MFRQVIVIFRAHESRNHWTLYDKLVVAGYPMNLREYADTTQPDVVKGRDALADSFVWKPCV